MENNAQVEKSRILFSPLCAISFNYNFTCQPEEQQVYVNVHLHLDGGRGQKPSKAQIRFAVRQKRADTKQAIKDFLLYGKSSKLLSQEDSSNRRADGTNTRNVKAKNSSHDFDDIPRSKGSGKSKSDSSKSGRGKRKAWNRKQRFYDIDDDDVDPENIFEATFGGQKCYTWSFTWTENLNFKSTTTGFNMGSESKKERTWNMGGESRKKRTWKMGGESQNERTWKKFCNESDVDEEPEPTNVGCHSDRVTLGLPPTGPLKLDDVKSAFRASALKWHPDKHQGPSQNLAAEKFKLCVTAYNSLSSALKPA